MNLADILELFLSILKGTNLSLNCCYFLILMSRFIHRIAEIIIKTKKMFCIEVNSFNTVPNPLCNYVSYRTNKKVYTKCDTCI